MNKPGTLLRVNLTTGVSRTEPVNQVWAQKYFGGRGLASKYLFEELKSGTAPLSADNILVLATGPLTGTIVPCSGKLEIVSKSPATGAIVDSSVGGTFASQLKAAGYDLLIIQGRAEKPVYLVINNDRITFCEAGHLWGQGIEETERGLHGRYGQDVSVLGIGPAGENLVPFACIGSEKRQAGRGGLGAVMGSKNLKSIVCCGNKDVTVPNISQFMEMTLKIMREDVLSPANSWVNLTGTPMLVDMSNSAGILPTRNYQDGMFEGALKINAESLQKMGPEKRACFGCALGCGNYVKARGSWVEGPEYETLALAGSSCGIDDLEAITKFNSDCDNFGIDTISMGNVLGFAMEMTQRGLKDFGLKFGDVESYLHIPGLVARQEGIGMELGMGVKRLAKKYGGEAFAMQVKGLELPGYDPRGSWAMGLAYATASRGGCHMSAWPVADEAFGSLNPFTSEGKAQLVMNQQDLNSIKFSLILCDFWAVSYDTMSRIMSSLYDRPVPVAELKMAGERIWTLLRLFNLREGFRASDDSLPERLFKDALKTGHAATRVLPREDFDIMLKEYYQLRGWDINGVPTQDKLLGLEM